MVRKRRVIYYSDLQNDEFSGDNIHPKTIDGNYKYLRENFISKIFHIFWYRMIGVPLAKLYMKFYFGHRIVNRERLKEAEETGYFMYGNHTHFLADALVPAIVNLPRAVFVIVHPNNVSMPVLGKITPYLGALPLPDNAEAGRQFVKAVEHKIKQRQCVMIYPEAHIWPYYTDIRPFADTSFHYPVKYSVPTFCLTNTYQKRKYIQHPRMVTYIDGPFYSDSNLPAKMQKQALRAQVYAKMKERALNNNVEVIRYVKKYHEKSE